MYERAQNEKPLLVLKSVLRVVLIREILLSYWPK